MPRRRTSTSTSPSRWTRRREVARSTSRTRRTTQPTAEVPAGHFPRVV